MMSSSAVAPSSFLPHILRTTLDSLTLLTSSGALAPSHELEHVKSQLQDALLHASSLARLSVNNSSSALTDPQQYRSAHGSAESSSSSAQHQHQQLPNLPPRRTPSIAGSSAAAYSTDPTSSQTSYSSPAAPSSYPSASNVVGQEQQQLVRALWDYNGTEPDDLSFRRGDTIVITEHVNAQWLRGRLAAAGAGGRTGLFPENYVERIQPQPQPQQQQQAGMPLNDGAGGGGWNEKQQQQQQQQQVVGGYPHPPYPSANGGGGPPAPPPAGYSSMYTPSQAPPPPLPPQLVVPQQQQQDEAAKKQGRFGKFAGSGLGNTLVHSAVGGFGFGAGSAVAGDIVHSIF